MGILQSGQMAGGLIALLFLCPTGEAAAPAKPTVFDFTFISSSTHLPAKDGLSIRRTGETVNGKHTGLTPPCDHLGGLMVLNAKGGKEFALVTSDYAFITGDIEYYIIDPTLLTWQLYLQNPKKGISLHGADSGSLVTGRPAGDKCGPV